MATASISAQYVGSDRAKKDLVLQALSNYARFHVGGATAGQLAEEMSNMKFRGEPVEVVTAKNILGLDFQTGEPKPEGLLRKLVNDHLVKEETRENQFFDSRLKVYRRS